MNTAEASNEAHASIQEDAETLRGRIWLAIRESHGLTCDEVEVRLGLRHQTASARIRELAQRGVIKNSGFRGRTRSGRYAVIWYALEPERG